jgi:SAM-dependent methyltransferase
LNVEDEISVYDKAKVSCLTGETESYDTVFFSNVIRKKEIKVIKEVLLVERPWYVLDYGCGGGWLSRFLLKWGLCFVGIDASKLMVKNAKMVCHEADFVVCDAMTLPFKAGVFDFVIGISILHHLDLKRATEELKRISFNRSTFLFMEPNLLNPLSAFGRKIFPMETHTEGEKPYTLGYFKAVLAFADFKVERCLAMFFLSFPVARFMKRAKLSPPLLLVKMTYFFEEAMEKMPGIRHLNSNMVVIARKNC